MVKKPLEISENEKPKITLSDSEESKSEKSEELPIEKLTKKGKPKKPRSEKQWEAFKITQEKRRANIEKRNKEKKLELAKALFEEQIKEKPSNKKQKEIKETPKVESSEEEVIIVEKRKKPRKPKRIIVEESTSESEEEEEKQELPEIKEKQFKSQRNKKSLISVGKTTKPETKPAKIDFTNYFC
jgi:hypothetical protein